MPWEEFCPVLEGVWQGPRLAVPMGRLRSKGRLRLSCCWGLAGLGSGDGDFDPVAVHGDIAGDVRLDHQGLQSERAAIIAAE
jgi:hypothetical protein